MSITDEETLACAARIEALVDEMESYPDAEGRDKLTEIVQELLGLYGNGLARILEIVAREGDVGAQIIQAFTRDELISHLLLLHDLHPVDVDERVQRGLDEVRPMLKSHGGDVELLGIENGAATLRLLGHCSGCPSSAQTLKTAVEEAIRKVAPELLVIEAVEAELSPGLPDRNGVNFVPMSSLVHSTR